MRRYVNWGMLFFGTMLVLVGLSSALWVPIIQPELLNNEEEEPFQCEDYLQTDECTRLRDVYEENPDYAVLQQNLMDPRNTRIAEDLGGTTYFAALMEEDSSDAADIVAGRRGEFVRLDAIRRAEGTVQLWEIVSFDGSRFVRIMRFEGLLEEAFYVTNGLELAVYLAENPAPESSAQVFDGGAVEIDVLGGNQGNRDYEIPADIDLTRYNSVVIYDRQLEIVFSYATLN